MVPAANLIGCGGEEVARKSPRAIGIVVDATLGSISEIVLFAILITKPSTETFNPVLVTQAAILGPVLASLLLCIGLCLFFSGRNRKEQDFHMAVSEVASGLMLIAGMALLLVPGGPSNDVTPNDFSAAEKAREPPRPCPDDEDCFEESVKADQLCTPAKPQGRISPQAREGFEEQIRTHLRKSPLNCMKLLSAQ